MAWLRNLNKRFKKQRNLLFLLGLAGIAIPADSHLVVHPAAQPHPAAEFIYYGDVCEDIPADMLQCQGVQEEHVQEKKDAGESLEEAVDRRYADMVSSKWKRRNLERKVRRINRHDKDIRRYARLYGVEFIALIKAHMLIEGNGEHYKEGEVLTSSAGAKGIMQLMPKTAKWLRVNHEILKQNLRGGVKYIGINLRYYKGNIVPAITAYNAGPGGTDRLIKKAGSDDFMEYRKFARGARPEEVWNYTINVLTARRLFKNFERYEKTKGKIIIMKRMY